MFVPKALRDRAPLPRHEILHFLRGVEEAAHREDVYIQSVRNPFRPCTRRLQDVPQPVGPCTERLCNDIGEMNMRVAEDFCNKSVPVYSPTASGDTAPIPTLAGATTLLNGPFALAVDMVNDELVITNFDSVTVYSRTASGDTGPSRMLGGASTGLLGADGLAVDTVNNELVVANFNVDSITVYGRTASGDVAPARTLAGGSTGLSGPSFLAVTTGSSVQTASLAVVRTGNGSGTVTSSDGNINCGSTCSETVTSGTSITLTATPNANNTFAGWSGGGCGGTGTCTVTVTASTTVIATFTIPGGQVTLSVARLGSGAGTVASTDGRISCGATCSAIYTAGASVTLTASAGGGVAFKQWGGACSASGTNPTCGLALNTSQSVTATFSEIFTDGVGPTSTISSGTTVIKAVHVLELRAAIDNLRAVYGLGAFPWTEGTLSVGSTTAKRIHFIDLRGALSPVCAALPGRCAAYTDPGIIPGQTVIKAAHIDELRANVRALE